MLMALHYEGNEILRHMGHARTLHNARPVTVTGKIRRRPRKA
jgi:hypothetical protein